MWVDLARYYDVIYDWKDYDAESEAVRRLIEENKKSDGEALLDIACGTGGHLQYLRDHFDVMGIDKNPAMLKEARKKCPGVPFKVADMVSIELDREFDAIICLFSSIGYLRTYRNLKIAIERFARHLRKGGVLLIEPFLTKESYQSGLIHGSMMEGDGVKISRMNVTKRRGDLAILDFHFLVGTKAGIRHIHDPHELALYETSKFLEILRGAGFRARFRKQAFMKDRGLFMAKRLTIVDCKYTDLEGRHLEDLFRRKVRAHQQQLGVAILLPGRSGGL